MSDKALISLRNPDKIYLVYGDETIELKVEQFDYIFAVDKSEVNNFKRFMSNRQE